MENFKSIKLEEMKNNALNNQPPFLLGDFSEVIRRIREGDGDKGKFA